MPGLQLLERQLLAEIQSDSTVFDGLQRFQLALGIMVWEQYRALSPLATGAAEP